MKLNKIIVLLLFFPFWCFSQAGDKLPLISILKQITVVNGARFGYIEEELVVYKLVPPNPKLSLKDKLEYIQERTRIRFEKVSSNFYTVYNDHKMDKPLCGFLKDAETGLGIESANVSISGIAVSTESDSKGYFELPIVSPNTVVIRHLNYEEKSIDPQDIYVSECPTISMMPKVLPLDEVTTQRYLATGIVKNELGELIVRPGKFGILPGLTDPDVLQTMQQVPGITSEDESVSNINVRGGTHDQNRFLWNGIPMFQTGHFFGLISAFNPLAPSSITIYKNGSPAFFGESVSSLIDISTHTGIGESNYGIVSLDLLNVNMLSKVKLSDKDAFQISLRRSYSDMYATPTFRAYRDRIFQNTIVTDVSQNQVLNAKSDEQFYFYDFSVQYQRKIGRKHEIIIDGLGIENAVSIAQQTATTRRNNHLAQQNFGGSFSWNSDWNEKNKSDFQGYLSWYNLDAKNQSIEFEQTIRQKNIVLDKGFRLRHKYIPSKSLELSAGYQFDAIEITNSDEIDDPAYSRNSIEISRTHTLFSEFLYSSKNTLTQFRAGLRENYFEKFNMVLTEPRVVFSQSLSGKLKLEIIGERKSQTLSQIIDLQQDFLGIEKRRWTLANETDIPIQKSSQASVGFTYSNNGWLIAVDNFYKKVTGITTKSQGFQNQLEYYNVVGDYRVLGSELLLQKSFKRFYGWISYSFNDNNYDFKTLTPSSFPNNFELAHSVTWAGIYEWRRLRLAIGSKWNRGKAVTTPSAFNIDPNNPLNSEIVYHSPNNARLGDYFQVNFSASKGWAIRSKTQLTASISILNIFNRNNVINRYYRVNTSENSIESVNTHSLGRTPNVSMKVSF